MLGAGRETKESKIDLSAGLVLNVKVDDEVKKGDILAYVHGNNMEKVNEVKDYIKDIIQIGEKNKKEKKLIFAEVTKDGIKLF